MSKIKIKIGKLKKNRKTVKRREQRITFTIGEQNETELIMMIN